MTLTLVSEHRNLTVPAPSALEGVALGQAAQLWAAAGWQVFPIVPRGKTPYAMGEFCGRGDEHSCGFHCATDDLTTLGLWWSLHPDSNIGLTSPSAFVVDEDRIGALIEAGVKLPRSPYQVTGRAGGGRHFFLHAPASWPGLEGDDVKVTPKVPAVEVKGFGKGYVVAAPSVHATGARYELRVGGYVPEAPEAAMRRLVDVERVGSSAFITIAGEGYQLPVSVGEGGRYEAIRSYVAHLYNRGFSIDEMWASVRTNLAPAFSPRLPERELRERFTRAAQGMERRLGERKAVPGVTAAAAAPLMLEDAPLTEFDSRPIEWAWPGWLPRGVVTVLDGNPGVSKSTLVADLVARMTTGGEWPDGASIDRPARAMWITTEDDPGRVLRPRIEAAGGDPAMVLFVRSEVVFPAAATAFLELLVKRAKEPLGLGLVVLDPLFSHIEASVRTIADAEMRRGVMNPLNDAAEAADTALLVVRHFSKDVSASAVNRGAGSLGGIVGAARALWTVVADPDDETGETKAVGVSKLNYARSPAPLRYRVVDRVPPGWVAGSVSGIEWIGEAPVSIAEILRETSSSREAQPVLLELLSKGPLPSSGVYAHMRSHGFGREATLSAKTRLGVRSTKTGMRGGWTWALPEESGSPEESGASDQPDSSADGESREESGRVVDNVSARMASLSEESEESGTDQPDSSGDSSDSSQTGDKSPHTRARARRDHHGDSSDSSGDETGVATGPEARSAPKSRKNRVGGRFTRARAREGAAPPLVALPTTGEWVGGPCADYSAHRSSHRRSGEGWICDACKPEDEGA